MATQHAHDHEWVPQWEFGDRLRKVRTDLGYDQKEFAALLELKAPTLSSYEAGRANPRSKDLPTLAARLELLTNVPRAGFTGKAHQLRHWYASTLLDEGVDVRVVKEMMRHESLATTEIYTKVSMKRMIDGIGKLPPPAEMKLAA